MQKLSLLAVLCGILLFSSCDHKIDFVAPEDQDLVYASNAATLADTTIGLNTSPGAATLWESFESDFKACFKNSNFQDKKILGIFTNPKYKLLYLGPTNSRYLGSVYSKDGVVPKTELTKWISAEDLKKIVTYGVPVAACDVDQMKKKFLELTIGSIPFSGADSTLRISWQNQDTITNSTGMWTIDGIDTEDLNKYLDENSDKNDIKYYKKVLTKDKNIVTFQIVKVSGFSADIVSKKNLTIKAAASIPLMKVKSAQGGDSTVFSFNYQTINNKTVHVESTGSFYLFGLAMQGKKL